METYGLEDAMEGGASIEDAFKELKLIDSKNVMEKACDLAKKVAPLLICDARQVMNSVPASEQAAFLLQFVLEAASTLPSKDQRHISTTLKTAADKKKEDEDKAKKAGGAKGKKPATKIASKGAAADMFDDFKTGDGGGTYNDFDDDFM